MNISKKLKIYLNIILFYSGRICKRIRNLYTARNMLDLHELPKCQEVFQAYMQPAQCLQRVGS